MAQTWSIHGTGAIARPSSSATRVRSTSVAPSPPLDSGSAIVVAPMAHSRSHRLLSNPVVFGGPDGLDGAVRREELPECRLQIGVILRQAVVLPAQLVAVDHPFSVTLSISFVKRSRGSSRPRVRGSLRGRQAG